MTSTASPSSSNLLSSPFPPDFGPRPLPTAAKKSFADLGSSSIRSAYNMNTLAGPPSASPMASSSSTFAGPSSTGIKVVNSNLRTMGHSTNSGFSVQRRTSSYAGPSPSFETGSSGSVGGQAGPSSRPAGMSKRHSSYGLGMEGGNKRKMFYAVAIGHKKGIYETWAEAEEQIKGHPAPQWKTFKTRLAAESYIISSAPFVTTVPADVDSGAYDMQLEYPSASTSTSSSSATSPTSPTYEAPLHERLQRDFPSTTPKSAPSPPLAELQPPRPHFARGNGSRSSSPSSPVKRSSPLRQEVTDDEAEKEKLDAVAGLDSSSDGNGNGQGTIKRTKKRASFMSRFSTGLLSPPTSPEAVAKGTKSFRVEAVERPVLAPPIVLPPTDVSRPNSRASSRTGQRSSRPPSVRMPSTGDVAAAAAYEQRPESIRSVSSSSIISRNGGNVGYRPPASPSRGLWGDVTPPLSPPLSPPNAKFTGHHHGRAASPSGSDADSEGFSSPTSNAPKFSRSALKKQNVLLPVPANASRSTSPALSRSPSYSSLKRKSSNNSLNSIGSFGSFSALRDKLAAVQIAEEPLEVERENVAPSAVNDKEARPTLAQRSLSKDSIASIASFATAQEEIPPSTPAKKLSEDGINPLADPERSLSPIHSNASGSEDHHGSSRSDATHTQSETCPGAYGNDRKLGKKRSFKRLLRALGLSKMDENKDKAEWARRSSA